MTWAHGLTFIFFSCIIFITYFVAFSIHVFFTSSAIICNISELITKNLCSEIFDFFSNNLIHCLSTIRYTRFNITYIDFLCIFKELYISFNHFCMKIFNFISYSDLFSVIFYCFLFNLLLFYFFLNTIIIQFRIVYFLKSI